MKVNWKSVCYRAMIGVGGIGAGSFFALSGNHTLGREESRGGRFLDTDDYCKLHIISHYVATLLGSEFTTIPVGKVGTDEVGRRLLDEMKGAGMNMEYVSASSGDQTLFSFCFNYPDGSGGNMTTDDSACSKVDAKFVASSGPEFSRFERQGIALAVPEVPIEARRELLRLGTKYGFLRVASFNSGEIVEARESGMLSEVDLLAINIDEARALVGVKGEEAGIVAQETVNRLWEINSEMQVSVTAGSSGSWSWDGTTLSHVPIFKADFQSSAGAGDAHLSGIIVGLVAGLSLQDAQQFGTLVAGLAITSPHTINKEIDRDSLWAFAQKSGVSLCDAICGLLSE